MVRAEIKPNSREVEVIMAVSWPIRCEAIMFLPRIQEPGKARPATSPTTPTLRAPKYQECGQKQALDLAKGNFGATFVSTWYHRWSSQD
jgi:hypothetical protein